MAQTKEGAKKYAAKVLGISLGQYEAHIENKEKWCTTCRSWKAWGDFAKGLGSYGLSAQCRQCQSDYGKKHYIPIPREKRKKMGPRPAFEREGDAKQARRRINVLVRTGRLPKPNNVPCQRCGHIHLKGEKRHEYHHVFGYSAGNHLLAVPLCTTCHHKVEKEKQNGR